MSGVHRLVLGMMLGSGAIASAAPLRQIDRQDYESRLHAMWLGECIANWTGLTTEGIRTDPPFLTDADWGSTGNQNQPIGFILNQNPWSADDDTDIEYVYLHLLHSLGHNALTPPEIRQGWIDHINRFIWVSNASARALMDLGVAPPMTGMGAVNGNWQRIDAQLTTEFFGAFAPGMTARALEMGDLPIRTTASGYAAHASQFFVALYAAAATVDHSLPLPQQIMTIVQQARDVIPDTSKSADVIDYVLADFATNPDINDWERTRDRIHTRFQALQPDLFHGFPSPASRGYRYNNWFESSVNLATGLIALLYGQGDYARTVQIGTLSGWDSDNGTATMGGLLGLLGGADAITQSFPSATFSDGFDILRTRDNLPDYLPADAAAQDTFTLMASRMIPIIEREIIAAGGAVDAVNGRWLLPPPRDDNPLTILDERSANNRVRRQGGVVSTSSSASSNPLSGYGLGQFWHLMIANAEELSFKGHEPDSFGFQFYSTQNAGAAPGSVQTLTVGYTLPSPVQTIRFFEGRHYPFGSQTLEGGWFQTASVEVRVGGQWLSPQAAGAGAVSMPVPLDPVIPFQIIDFVFENPVSATGVRITGPVGGSAAFVTCCELDALAPDPGHALAFDISGDGAVSVEDLYIAHTFPVDLDADGITNRDDRMYLQARLRWLEPQDMTNP